MGEQRPIGDRCPLSARLAVSIKAISPYAVDGNGVFCDLPSQFATQQKVRAEFAAAGKPSNQIQGYPYVVLPSAEGTGIDELGEEPIVLTNASLRHLIGKHKGTVGDIADLGGEIIDNVIAYQPAICVRPTVVVALGVTGSSGNELIAVLITGCEVQGVVVSEVRTVYGRSSILEDIAESRARGLAIHTNDKTDGWLVAVGFMGSCASTSATTPNRLPDNDDTRIVKSSARQSERVWTGSASKVVGHRLR